MLSLTINFFSRTFLGCAALLLAMLASAPLLGQTNSHKLQHFLNAAVHDTTFLKKAPEISYPLVFVHQQEKYYQQSPEAAVQPLPSELSEQSFTRVEVKKFDWKEEKQWAKLKMRWNDKIIKLQVRDLQEKEDVALLRGMKVRGKNKLWPSYFYFNGEM